MKSPALTVPVSNSYHTPRNFANNLQDLAWIGWKDSGKGQTLSKFGFDQFVRLKSYHIKDYPK